MAKTEDAHQLVVDKRFPGVPAAPRKARRRYSAYRQAFAEARLDLLPEPFQILQLLLQFFFRIAPDDDSGNIRNVRTHRVNETVSFDKDFDVQCQQPLERLDPAPAIHVRIGCRKIHAHECIRNDHQLLSPVVQHDVIVRVSRSGINLQTTACRAQLLSQHLKRRLQWWRRSDDEPAGPRQFKTLYEEFGGNRRNEHFGPSVLCQPIQIADMLFVMMCGNNRADCIQG